MAPDTSVSPLPYTLSCFAQSEPLHRSVSKLNCPTSNLRGETPRVPSCYRDHAEQGEQMASGGQPRIVETNHPPREQKHEVERCGANGQDQRHPQGSPSGPEAEGAGKGKTSKSGMHLAEHHRDEEEKQKRGNGWRRPSTNVILSTAP